MSTNSIQRRQRRRHINSFSNIVEKKDPFLPSMIVFDLDDCLWRPEMHELPGLPELPIYGTLRSNNDDDDDDDDEQLRGVIGLQVLRYKTTVRLHPSALQVLQELALDPRYEGIVLATASSSLEPSYSYACLEHLEVLPGLTINDMMSFNQIGRTGPLSPNKLTHFSQLHKESGIPYEEMVFFDDCNWGDHCDKVSKALGVTSRRTPHGVAMADLDSALEAYKQAALAREASK